MLPHQLRVVLEADDMRGKLGRLRAFTQSEFFKTQPWDDRYLLLAQVTPMEAYLAILDRRIAKFD